MKKIAGLFVALLLVFGLLAGCVSQQGAGGIQIHLKMEKMRLAGAMEKSKLPLFLN